MNLNELLASNMKEILSCAETEEEIVYTTKEGESKTISAVVTRKGLKPDGETNRILINQVEIVIANDSDIGISTITARGDMVSLPEKIGGINATWKVVEILGQDSGSWHLLLMK